MAAAPSKLLVFSSADSYLLQPPGSDAACLAVSRSSGSVRVRDALSAAERDALPTPFVAHAVAGLLPLSVSALLVLVTGRERAATLRAAAPLWRATAWRLLPCGAGDDAADGAAAVEARRADAAYSALLRLALAEPGLYYSDAVDATRGEQDAAAVAGAPPRPLAETADARFFWNAHLATPLLAARGGAAFVAPFFCGWAGEATVPLDGGAALEVLLLARRHVGRPGRRLWARGVDSTGAAANCVVSEQVLRLRGGGAAAHTAVRGSVPLLWTQAPDLSPKPRLRLAPPTASAPPLRAHMAALRAAHGGPVVSLSLLRARGREGALSDAFAAAAADAPGDVFIAFDFNAEAGASARGRAVLLHQVGSHLAAHGIFCADAAGAVRLRQAGIIRTNCLDCLDRTNMAQSALAAAAAAVQLTALQGGAGAPAEAQPAPADAAAALPAGLASALAALWRAHGDALSLQYTRTPAQRRDRSAPASATAAMAAARDAAISLRRYVQNNHGDGAACDAAALLTGAHVPPRAAAAAATTWPFPHGAAARVAHAARRMPLLQAAAALCCARVVAALRTLAALQGDLGAATGAFAGWSTLLLALSHVAERYGRALVARPLFALRDADAEERSR